MTDEEKTTLRDLASAIGRFYLEKNEHDYSKCHQEIRSLGIHELSQAEVGGINIAKVLKITIRLERPGLLIGCRGQNIEALIAFLSKEFKQKVTIRLFEEKYLDHLYPIDWSDRMNDFNGFEY